jgi:hypothetical protein
MKIIDGGKHRLDSIDVRLRAQLIRSEGIAKDDSSIVDAGDGKKMSIRDNV